MSIMFLDDVRQRPAGRANAAISVGLYAMAALVFAVVAPLSLSFVLGGVAPMLVLTVYLLPLVPVLLLVAGAGLAVGFIAPALKLRSSATHDALYN